MEEAKVVTKRKKPTTESTEIARVGKDEMNLAEFPTAILTNRSSNGVKTLRFRDNHGQLTVTGSDALGLPTPIDTDVLVALIEMTKKTNNFTGPKVNFTRYELIRLIGWANVGSSYDRLKESLDRWAGVLLIYDGCWWDNRLKKYVSRTVHVIEDVLIAEGRIKTELDGRQQSLPLSSFNWSSHFMESFQANNLKSLNTEFYFSLELPTSKQLFRFLDKRFANGRSEWIFNIESLAWEHVGLSRNYSVAKIKEKLGNAIKELETTPMKKSVEINGKIVVIEERFLKALSREERYFKSGDIWKVRFIDGRQGTPDLTPPNPIDLPQPKSEQAVSPLAAKLVKRGVSTKAANGLIEQYPAAYIEEKIEEFDFEMTKPKPPKKPAGYLVDSIRDSYAADPNFVSAAQRQKNEEARQAREQQEAAARRERHQQEAAEKAKGKRDEHYWESLTAEQQAALQAKIDAGADPAQLAQEVGPLKSMGQTIRRREFIRQLLDSQESGHSGQ